jgi:hypothetical protein
MTIEEALNKIADLERTVRYLQAEALLTDTTKGWKARALSAEECVEWWEENHDAAWMDTEICRIRLQRDAALAMVRSLEAFNEP